MVLMAAVPLASQSVDDVRARMGIYVARFIPQFANVVAVETYEQQGTIRGPGAASGRFGAPLSAVTRRFTSDLLLVRHPLGELNWMMFRDVTTIDGERLRHEENRLMTLFASPTIESTDRAALIALESQRYLLPGGSFALTNPLLVLALMQTHYQDRLRFRLGGSERSLGPRVRVLAFEELESRPPEPGSKNRGREALPPLLGGTVRVRGKVWVDAQTGRIVKTEARISTGAVGGLSTSTTTFEPNERLGLTVPVEMRTTWPYGAFPVTGVATYADYRRFAVTTGAIGVELPD
jgi:hypothetical protein